jgi:hypothetical protein
MLLGCVASAMIGLYDAVFALKSLTFAHYLPISRLPRAPWRDRLARAISHSYSIEMYF